jgi:TP901 family phage tail tape measure protein
MGRTAQQINKNSKIIEQGILRQMERFPASSQEMTDALYEIYSSTVLGSRGLKGVRDGLKFLTVANKAAVAGQVDLSEVTKAMTTVMNAFGGGVQAIGPRLQRMFAAVRFGRITFGELLQALNQLVPAGTAASQSFDSIVGSFSALTRVMPNARMASTALARLMETIGRKAFVTGMEKWGHSITDAHGRLLPLVEIIPKFNKLIKEQPEKDRAGFIRNFFKEVSALGEGTKSGFESTVQARRALVNLIKHYGLYSEVLGQVTTDNNEFTKSFRIMASRTGVQWSTFVNKMRAAWLSVGAAAIPVLMELLKPLKDIADAFSELDDEQRNQIVRWTAMGAAILIVGGTLVKVASSIGVIISGMKMAGHSLSLWGAGIVAVSALLLILIGQGDMVKSVFINAFDAITASTQRWLAALGLILLSMSRLSKAVAIPAFLGFRRRAGTAGAAGALIAEQTKAATKLAREAAAAQAALAAITIVGPRARGPGGRFVKHAEVQRLRDVASHAARGGRAGIIMRGAMQATAASIALLPGPLKVAVGLTAAIAGAAYLVDRHFDSVRKKAENLAAAQRKFTFLGQRPIQAATALQPFAQQTIDARRALLNLQQIDLQIKQLRRSIQGATGDERKMLSNQLQVAILDRADAFGVWRLAVNNASVTAKKFVANMQGQANILSQITVREDRLRTLNRLRDALTGVTQVPRRKIDELLRTLGMSWRPMELASTVLERVNRQIDSVTSGIAFLQSSSAKAAITLKNTFSSIVREFQRAELLPKRLPTGAIEAMIRVATARGRMLKLPEMRAVIQAIIDPASLRRMPADIRRSVGLVRIEAEVATRQRRVTSLQEQIRRAMKAGEPEVAQELRVKLAGEKKALADARTAHTRISRAFSKVIKQQVKVNINPPVGQMYTIGLEIANGVAHGIIAGIPAVERASAALTYAAQASSSRAGEVGSPSMLMAREVGLPLAQGVAVGIRKGIPDIVLAGTEMIELFTGKIISDIQAATLQVEFFASKFLEDLKKITPAALVKDMQQQATQLQMFVGSISALARRGVPRELINQLRQLGQEGAEKLRILAQSSDRELKRYVAAWKRAQEAVRRFSRITAQDLINDIKSQGAALRSMVRDLNKLAARGVPAIIIAQLAKLGVEGAAHVKKLASMTQAQLKKWVAAWYAANAQLRKLMDMASFEDILQRNKDFFARLFDPMELVSRVKQMAEDVKSAMISAFGTLFSDAIRSRVGQAFRDAVADWNSQMAGLERELSDAYNELNEENARFQKELADAQAQAIRDRANELQQQFGQLLAGDWLRDRIDWRSALRMSDLKRDLQEQINAFKDWRQSLATLAGRNLPTGLLKQLEDLGIENRDLIRLLASSTDAELQEYVDLWRQGQGMINDVAQTAVADTQEIAARHAEAVASIMERISDIQARMSELAKQKPEPLTFADILADLQRQKDAFQDWIATLETLRQRNVPAELLQQLRELGPEAVDILRILANATDEELLRYIELWKSAGVSIGEAAKAWAEAITPEEILTGMRKQVEDFQAWQNALGTLMNRVLQDGTRIPAQLLKALRELGPEALPYLQALINMTDEQLQEFIRLWKTGNAEITAATMEEWKKNGRALAQGFIEGLAEASPALARALGITLVETAEEGAEAAGEAWFRIGSTAINTMILGVRSVEPQLLQALKNALTNTQPIIEFGVPIWEGLGSTIANHIGLAFANTWAAWAQRIKDLIGSVAPAVPEDFGAGLAGATSKGGGNVYMDVHALQNESLMSTLERATFRLRNRT